MVMFTLLVMFTSGAVTLTVERNRGILRRLASSPMSRGYFEYNTDLLERKTVARMADDFHALLAALIAAPDMRLTDLDVVRRIRR